MSAAQNFNTKSNAKSDQGSNTGSNQGSKSGGKENMFKFDQFSGNQFFNQQNPFGAFMKTNELFQNIQVTLFNAMRELTTLNAEFSHKMIAEMQNNLANLNPSNANPIKDSMNTDSVKNWMEHVVKHSQSIANISQNVCSDVTSKVKDHCIDASKAAAR